MKIHDYLTQHLETPFEWGVNDCVTFVAHWLEACTGVDHLEGLPVWTSEEEAQAAIEQLGGIEKVLDEKFKRINSHLARDGDIGMVDGRAVLFSGSKVVSPSFSGLIYVNRTKASCAWSY